MSSRAALLRALVLICFARCTPADPSADSAHPQRSQQNVSGVGPGESQALHAPQDATTDGRYLASRPSGLKMNECPLLPSLERALLGVPDVLDCGTLPAAAMPSMLRAAHGCVLDAQRAGRAFRVTYHPPSYDTLESTALAGRGLGARAVYIHRTSTPVAPWIMRAWRRAYDCGELRAREGCTFDQGDLCLDCVDAKGSGERCEKHETF